MSGEVTVVVQGLPELIAKLETLEFVHAPARKFMDTWRFAVVRQTMANFARGYPGGWIDTGGARQSTTSVVDDSPIPKYAQVGSNKMNFRWGEFGTGLLSDDPDSKHRRFRPPAAALEDWAQRHGTTGAEVADAIFKAGGLKPRKYLRNAMDSTAQRIPAMVVQFAHDIEAAAAAGGGG